VKQKFFFPHPRTGLRYTIALLTFFVLLFQCPALAELPRRGSEAVQINTLLEFDFHDFGGKSSFSQPDCIIVWDSALNRYVMEFRWEKGSMGPTCGRTEYHFAKASDEITIKYKIKMSPNWPWTVHHHFLMLKSNLDVANGIKTPANAFGSTYFEWDWFTKGVFMGKFQDNRSINCSVGTSTGCTSRNNNCYNVRDARVDLTNITEMRSVGGYQTFDEHMPAGQSAVSWGCPCCRGLEEYTGQSFFKLCAIGAKDCRKYRVEYDNAVVHPMTEDQWWDTTIYLKKNSIVGGKGIRDGYFQVWWQGPDDPNPVQIMDHDKVLWRTGANKDLKWEMLMIAPFFHDGALHEGIWFRIAYIGIYNGNWTEITEPDKIKLIQ